MSKFFVRAKVSVLLIFVALTVTACFGGGGGGSSSGGGPSAEKAINAVLDRYASAMMDGNVQVLVNNVYTFPFTIIDDENDFEESVSKNEMEAALILSFASMDFEFYAFTNRSITVSGNTALAEVTQYEESVSTEWGRSRASCPRTFYLKNSGGWRIYQVRLGPSSECVFS